MISFWFDQDYHRCKAVWYIWSPLFFGLAIDFVMKIAVDKDKRRLTLVPRRSRYLQVKLADMNYTDDITLFNQSVNGAEAHATIQRIAISNSIYPIYAHEYSQNNLIFMTNLIMWLKPHHWKLQHVKAMQQGVKNSSKSSMEVHPILQWHN